MSRSPHLPPRCPTQMKGLSPSAPEFTPQSKTYPNGESPFPEQPSWFDDLLTEIPKMNLNLNPIRRTCSDSAVILDVLTTGQREFEKITRNDETDCLSEVAFGLESGCLYGPNSPRQKSQLSTNESSMVNAVLENVPSNPLQYLVLDPESCSGSRPASVFTEITGNGDASNGTVNHDPDRNSRRRSGQRSRVRKLQYIAELERTVDSLQSLGAELAGKVASLFQLRAALSKENKSLRRQIAGIRQEKLVKDGVSQALRNEAERLKQLSGRHRRSRSLASFTDMVGRSTHELGPAENSLALSWQIAADMNKLSLGGSSVPVPPTRHRSGRF
ncbi:Basic-leucine zipper (bZIP) transcription factor family protein [Rhynchospora pubera]|uniref:Basic-leucine zipper (BZIP) transcription factor family protein n=1 Tax=Rhynchospora pubera TaxID=906938 RepID=A0AAV8CZJ9_9POAL|nr:Basic-leucine zipper (bZIP) transcription factor family protein [Rhynchospora pubera]KAJ4790230.1 Basic-leucine zipper (bZIP) transcription factor family protein [Rhynchospora pubera]